MSRFHHLCHLRDVPLVKAGQYIKRGTLIGYVGTTGHSTAPHCHYEVTKNKPTSWYMYPTKYMNRAQVLALYTDPAPFIRDGMPCEFKSKGYGFTQPEPSGLLHPGVDINSPNDLGKPVYSPINGRVAMAEGLTMVKSVLGRFIPSFYNRGFGNHVWIEQDEANPGLV